jgi:ABC-2 type transport system ATP-binding protein
MWVTIQDLVRGGSTVLLTTQYMDEAERLADDIVVIDKGRKIAHGTSDELKMQIGGERIEVALSNTSDVPAAQSILDELSVGDVQLDEQTRRLTAGVSGGADILRQVLQRLGEANIAVVDVGLRRPTLDDVFLTLTGHAAEDVAKSEDETLADLESETGDVREKEAVR